MSDWPHDPDGDEGSEGRRKYGQAIIAKKIDEDEDFPLDLDEFTEEYGDDPIRIDHKAVGQTMRENGYRFYELA